MVAAIPNILTVGRLIAVPVYIYILFGLGDEYRLLAMTVFGAAALTDFFDGYLARRLNAVSEFGKIADPCVDRVLIMSALIALYVKTAGIIPFWTVALVVGRDIAMLLGSGFLLAKGDRPPINMAGKISTTVLLASLCLVTLRTLAGIDFAGIGMPMFYGGVALSLLTGLFYTVWGTKMLLGKQGSARIPV
ncbi:MAG: CDP-alcohol phosphatidyltransferase family protein [Candidatus Aquicultorales bacterium]